LGLENGWKEEFKKIFLDFNREEFDKLKLLKIIGEKGRIEFASENFCKLSFTLLGFRINLEYNLKTDNLDLTFEDLVEGKKEDLEHLLFVYGRILKQRLHGFLLDEEKNFVNISMLHGGVAGKAYEKKIVDFLIGEMANPLREEVEKICKIMDGHMVQHLTSDWAYELRILNGFRVRLVYWCGEEGIPPNISVLYGSEILKTGLPIEDIVVLTEIFVNRFIASYRKITGRKPVKQESLYY